MANTSPSAEILNDATRDGGIVNPVPQWRRGALAPLCTFDGGCRFSLSVVGSPRWFSACPLVLRALSEHERTWQPAPLGDGGAAPLGDGGAPLPFVEVRGASGEELSYFVDYPADGAVCFVSDEWRVILRRSVLEGVVSQIKNDVVVILGWRAFCDNPSIQAAFLRVCAFLRSLGLAATLQRINRVDVNATVDDVSMELVRECFHRGLFWTRATPGLHQGTVYFGRRDSAVLFRAYDKSAELRSAVDTVDGRAKLRHLAHYFPVASLSHLTRFEFEIHRKELDRFSVRDFCDLENKLCAILQRLCNVLLTVRENPYNKTRADRHKDRVNIAPFWSYLSDAFQLFARQISSKQIQVKTRRQGRTTGEKSKKTADRYARIFLDECFRVRREFDTNTSDSDIWQGVFVDLMFGVLRRSPSVGESTFNPRELLTRYTLEGLNDGEKQTRAQGETMEEKSRCYLPAY